MHKMVMASVMEVMMKGGMGVNFYHSKRYGIMLFKASEQINKLVQLLNPFRKALKIENSNDSTVWRENKKPGELPGFLNCKSI